MATTRKAPTAEDITIGDRFKRARENAGLTLEAAAAKIGVTNQAINQWEMGKTRPGGVNLNKVMEVYSTDYDRLFRMVNLTKEAHLPANPPTSSEIKILTHDKRYTQAAHEGLRIEGEVAAGLWREVHPDEHSDLGHQDVYDDVPIAIDPRWPRQGQYGLIVRGTSINNIALDGDVLSCVDISTTAHRLEDRHLVIVERQRDAGMLIERTAKRWLELPDRYELWPDSTDPRWQEPIIVPKMLGFDAEGEDGITVTLKAIVTWVHRPTILPVRRR